MVDPKNHQVSHTHVHVPNKLSKYMMQNVTLLLNIRKDSTIFVLPYTVLLIILLVMSYAEHEAVRVIMNVIFLAVSQHLNVNKHSNMRSENISTKYDVISMSMKLMYFALKIICLQKENKCSIREPKKCLLVSPQRKRTSSCKFKYMCTCQKLGHSVWTLRPKFCERKIPTCSNCQFIIHDFTDSIKHPLRIYTIISTSVFLKFHFYAVFECKISLEKDCHAENAESFSGISQVIPFGLGLTLSVTKNRTGDSKGYPHSQKHGEVTDTAFLSTVFPNFKRHFKKLGYKNEPKTTTTLWCIGKITTNYICQAKNHFLLQQNHGLRMLQLQKPWLVIKT